MSRVLIMAGGTGGHVFPGLAVANIIKQRGIAVFWMGTEQGIEAKMVPEAGYPLTIIKVRGLRGNGLLGWLLAPFKLMIAVFEAFIAIRQIKPNVVLGLGGFASGPGGLAAWLLRKPIVIHEQNAIPGLTNRLLYPFAKRILTGFANSFDNKRHTQWVGNPVRPDIADIAPPEKRFSDHSKTTSHLLVLGGSLGARSLNRILPEALALMDKKQRPIVRHQCGYKHYQDCKQAYDSVDVQADIVPFIDDMKAAYEWADLVVCRAGALTIAELAAVGVGAILVPYPYAVDDHQTHNAQSLVKVGAAYIINERDLSARLLADKISQVTDHQASLLDMAKAGRHLAKIEAATVIADICIEVAHG